MKKVLSHSFVGQKKDSQAWASSAVQHQTMISWNNSQPSKMLFTPYCESAAPVARSPTNQSCYTARKNQSSNDILNQTTINCK